MNVDKVELLANDIAPMLAVVASRKTANLISYGELVRLLKALSSQARRIRGPTASKRRLPQRSGARLGSFSGGSRFRAVERGREREDRHPRIGLLRRGY
jgi:hypothetical protein